MIRLVIDTNILVAACLKEGGTGRQVIKKCLSGSYRPLIGTALFTEYEDVMGRDALFQTSPLSKSERQEVYQGYLAACQWTEVYYAWRPNLPDEADNHLIELAVAGGASAIVTRNVKDLAKGELRFPQVKVLLPEQCLEIFQ
jgi:putative PIN family toxin of toxin-antitoxin system